MLSDRELYNFLFPGTEGSGPAALGLQQPADGRGGTGAGVGSTDLLQPGREHERLEQSSQPQPPAHLLPHGTTLDSRAQLYVRVYNIVKRVGEDPTNLIVLGLLPST